MQLSAWNTNQLCKSFCVTQGLPSCVMQHLACKYGDANAREMWIVEIVEMWIVSVLVI